ISVIGDKDPALAAFMLRCMEAREFIAAGRYMYAAGRPMHQVNILAYFLLGYCLLSWGTYLGMAVQSWMSRLLLSVPYGRHIKQGSLGEGSLEVFRLSLLRDLAIDQGNYDEF
ncbi:MAG: hypothetical protein F6K10_18535, partial [Moorea sp. SIO2B7]|nr:hypothetical protein [Moorena sp. SIO2B7]